MIRKTAEKSAKLKPGAPAARALQEAEERRKARDLAAAENEKEVGGREGLNPARYGDWEKDGITSDF